MGYELFDNKAVRLGSPALTITGDGRMSINADAGDLLRRVGAKFVHILWDAAANKIALRPLTEADTSAFKLTSKSGRRGMVISGATFLRHIGWDVSKPATIAVKWNEKTKVLEASLPRRLTGHGR